MLPVPCMCLSGARLGSRLFPSRLAPRLRLSSSSTSARAARPRALPTSAAAAGPGPDYRYYLAGAVLAAVVVAPLAYLGLHGGLELWDTLTAIDTEDLMGLLPGVGAYEGGGSSQAAAAAAAAAAPRALARAGSPRHPLPTATLLLGWEGVCVEHVYHPKAGYTPVPRPGLAALLLAAAEAGLDTVLWSPASQSDSVREQLARLVEAQVAPLDQARYADFQGRVSDSYERARAVEVGRAAREGRPPAPMLPVTPRDRTDLYLENVLRVPAVLGKEHCAAGGARPLAVLCHERLGGQQQQQAMGGCLAVDCVEGQALGLPARPPATGSGSGSGSGAYYLSLPQWRAGEGDFSLYLLAELLREYSAWRRQGGGAGEGGVADFLAAKQTQCAAGQEEWAGVTQAILTAVAQGMRARMSSEQQGKGSAAGKEG